MYIVQKVCFLLKYKIYKLQLNILILVTYGLYMSNQTFIIYGETSIII